MASSSSFSSASNSQYCPRWKYNVFLSFRGKDTRRNFTSHLYQGLKDRGIFTFLDDERLEDDDSISEELVKAIEESQVAIIVFSKNYATSRWCLNELVKIMECKEKENGQTVIPVFCYVDPSHVRNQSKSFAKAFVKHESRYKYDVEGMHKVQGWRNALTAAADLKGYDIRDGIESEKIQQIVDHISSKFCKSACSLSYLQDIVGINAHLEKLKSLLQIEINDVRIVGIWGIGGIGKTTIAKAIFDTLSHQFKAACFLANVKENAEKNQLHSLQNTLLSELLGKIDNYVYNEYNGKCMTQSRLCSMKVLIVLDDIDHDDHLDYLAGDVGWFGNGSRVIVTTRNRQLIEKDAAIYEVPTLPDHEAMQLFNHHAFKKEVPDECFKKFSLEVVNHAKGLPLALKVWGSLLHKKGLTQWRRTIHQIKKNSNSEIVEKLKISYDGLEPEEQKIFLDIACFFRRHGRKKVIQIVESYDSGAEYILDILIEKALVFISEYDRIEMHDLIEDMGKYIVNMQKDSGKPSRLWNVEDFKDVMVGNMGTMTVEAIWFTYFEKLRVSKEAMKNMQRLRILCIQSYSWASQSDSEENPNCSIEYLPNNLCWFVWHKYPWKLLPNFFNPRSLVHLDLRGSLLHPLWSETKQFPCLRRLDLSHSKSLERTPNFEGMPNLEYFNLEGCRNLEEVHHSLKYCGKLIQLNLYDCRRLKMFPSVNVESLESLDLHNCFSLEKFPEILGIMKPLSIIHLEPPLTELDLSFLKNLVPLPSSIGMFKSLVKLRQSGCFKFESLSKGIRYLEELEELDASYYTLISQPPSSIIRLNKLKSLSFAKQKTGRGLVDGVFFVFLHVNELLNLKNCSVRFYPYHVGNHFEDLPRSIAQVGSLQDLNLSVCRRFNEFLNLNMAEGFCSLKNLNLNYSNLEVLNLSGNNFEHLPQSIAQLGALRSLNLADCKSLTQLPEFPHQLYPINADWSNDSICNSLFQNISSLQHDISASDSLSVRVLWSLPQKIPSWFHHQGMGSCVSVNLPENWFVSDKFLGFAVCYLGNLFDITAHLIPLCDDGMSSMTQEFALSNHSEYIGKYGTHFLLVTLGGLWDANGKTPNDYGCIQFYSEINYFGAKSEFGVRLLYKDDTELYTGIRKSRYEEVTGQLLLF